MLTGALLGASRSLQSLRFAVRPTVIAHYLGQLLVPLGLLTLVPTAVAAWTGSPDVARLQLAVTGGLLVLGFAGRRLGPAAPLQRNEALALTALVFPVASLAGAIPLTAYGLTPLDAWFEAVSGATTTGLSVLRPDETPAGLLFARAWLQWVGGLGVLVLALALLVSPGASARRMGFSSREVDDVVGGTRAHARRVLTVYLALTALGLGLLLLLGMEPFDALLHVFAAVSTGGFGSHDASLATFSRSLQVAVVALCFLGAVAFACYYQTLYRHPVRLLTDRRVLGLLGCCVIAALALVGLGWTHTEIGGETRSVAGLDLVLLAVSAQTTAGFSTASVASLHPAEKLVLVGSMLVGGEIGSTAGGIKVFRLLVVLGLLKLLLDRASIPPSARLGLRVGRDRIDAHEVEGVIAYVAAYGVLIAASWLAFVAHGHPGLDALFEVVSAVGTVGLSAGLSARDLEPALKAVLSLDMLMGRVEVVAFLLLLRPTTWLGRRRIS